MAQARNIIRPIISIVLVGGTALGLINVFSDNKEVVKLAERTACGGEECAANMTQMMRSPFSQSFTFHANPKGKAAHSVDVKCTREYILIGDYGCERQSNY